MHDAARDYNKKLAGMGGVYNLINFNLYHYAGNNPVKYVDPDGRAPKIPSIVGAAKNAEAFIEGAKEAANEKDKTPDQKMQEAMQEMPPVGDGQQAWAAVGKMIEGAKEKQGNKKTANSIANGHAYDKHATAGKEFGPQGISREEFAKKIENVMNNPTAKKDLGDGKTAYWNKDSGMVVIHNDNASDKGTAYRPGSYNANNAFKRASDNGKSDYEEIK